MMADFQALKLYIGYSRHNFALRFLGSKQQLQCQQRSKLKPQLQQQEQQQQMLEPPAFPPPSYPPGLSCMELMIANLEALKLYINYYSAILTTPLPQHYDPDSDRRSIVRVHGQEPHAQIDRSPKVLFSTPRIKQQFKQYKQAESAVIKANIECQMQGDVVIEGIHVGDNDHEEIMFRTMFDTCFVQSNVMVFTLDDVDLAWNCTREKLQEDFKIEVFFSEVELSDIDSPIAETLGESHDGSELSSLGNAEEFYDFDILIDSDLNSGT